MTQDDESSVYVGGLSYDSTEDMLQKAFETFGDINSIKIVYDRESGQSRGFGFVTFTNPRAAAKAIHGLDGGILGGRTIRVNEVKKNSGKTLNREASFRERGERDQRGSRDRDRDHNGRGRNFSPRRNRRSSPGQGRSTRGRSPLFSPGPGRSNRTRSPVISPVQGRSARNRSPSNRRSRSPRAARSPSYNSSSAGRPHAHSSPTSPSRQSSDGSLHRREEGPHRTQTLSSRVAKEKQSDVVKDREELNRAVQSRQELEDKVANLTSAVEQAKETVSALTTKTQKLEESLANAQAMAAHRQHQLRKLQKGILQVRDSSDRLKGHEKDLKALMTAAMTDLDVLDVDIDDRLIAVGNGGRYDGDRKADDAGALLIEKIKA